MPFHQGRTAYLKWREDLKRMHSRTVMGLMAEAGYDEAAQKAVEELMLKKALKTPEGQVGSVAGLLAPCMHVGMVAL
jgi:hypothetical protein